MSSRTALIVVSEDWYFLSHRLPIATALQKNGFEVHVACKTTDGEDKIEQLGFVLHPLTITRDSISPFQSMKTISQLKMIMKAVQPDIVINVALFMVLFGSIAAFFNKTRCILNIITGLGYSFISNHMKAKVIRSVIYVFFRLFSISKRIHMVAQNHDDLQLIVKCGFQHGTNLHLILGSGVDSNKFKPSSDDKGYITFVGRLLWSKGVKELAEAAILLEERGRDYKVIFVGAPDELNPQTARQEDIQKWSKYTSIEFWGRRDDIVKIYQQSCIAVLPSWREGLPKSLLEAASTGLPLVATDAPGCREIVKDATNGFLVPLRDSESLADAIDRLMQDTQLRQNFGWASRKRVEEDFNEDVISRKFIDLIKVIMERN